ncbi:hypothetical protein AA984_08325 [Brevibacillus formosus]|uniref:Uncharacterized protein n=1 Tax=Brevibacillus formosus TaxID=54913 RepID=A0A837KR09_9BACL|nr:hypothetical protein AA984_08325 [Brevibacillus formosus]PSJ96180.1 hypothetical protein C7R91_15905 [Brevibacillus formosus]GED56549.1 hypothetical protein BFO01nite_06810 [Brevibacillus formosus]
MAGRLEDPFGMKFILPEHVTLLYQHQLDKQLVKQPVIEEDELASFRFRLWNLKRASFAPLPNLKN